MTAATTTTRPSVPHRRLRVLLPLAVVTALAVGGGSAAVKALSAESSGTSQPSRPASSVVSGVDVPTLWADLGSLPAVEANNIVADLGPAVRAQLRSTTQAIAARAKVSDRAVDPHADIAPDPSRIRRGVFPRRRWTKMVSQGARPCDFARSSLCPSGARGRSRWWR